MTSPPTRVSSLVQVSTQLLDCTDYAALTDVYQQALIASTRYRTGWLAVLSEDRRFFSLLSISGTGAERVRQTSADMPVAADPMMAEIIRSVGPVVVEDARTDPRTNKGLVEHHGNRTIINIPYGFVDRPTIAIGCGTFSPEPVRPPLADELDFLLGLGALVSVAASRIRFAEEQRAASAERERLEAQLLQAEKLKSLGLLAGGIAHDFNNLLAGVLGHTELGLEAEELGSARAALRQVQLGALRAREIIDQIQAFSGNRVIRQAEVDLTEACRELVRLLRPSRPPGLAWQVTGMPAGTLGDAGQLRQVLLNLLTNAADALPSGQGTISVSVTMAAELPAKSWLLKPHPAATYVLVEVKDTGEGMTSETLSRVFDPFFSTKGKGRGMGLAAVLGTMERHRGGLACTTAPGAGTSFQLAFPHQHLTTEATNVPRTLLPCRILVADDNDGVHNYLKELLQGHGHTVLSASDGEAALAILEAESVDLAVIDVLMPRMAGTEVLRIAIQLGVSVPTLLISGFLDNHAVPTGDRVAFLPKPLHGPEVLAALTELRGDPS